MYLKDTFFSLCSQRFLINLDCCNTRIMLLLHVSPDITLQNTTRGTKKKKLKNPNNLLVPWCHWRILWDASAERLTLCFCHQCAVEQRWIIKTEAKCSLCFKALITQLVASHQKSEQTSRLVTRLLPFNFIFKDVVSQKINDTFKLHISRYQSRAVGCLMMTCFGNPQPLHEIFKAEVCCY